MTTNIDNYSNSGPVRYSIDYYDIRNNESYEDISDNFGNKFFEDELPDFIKQEFSNAGQSYDDFYNGDDDVQNYYQEAGYDEDGQVIQFDHEIARAKYDPFKRAMYFYSQDGRDAGIEHNTILNNLIGLSSEELGAARNIYIMMEIGDKIMDAIIEDMDDYIVSNSTDEDIDKFLETVYNQAYANAATTFDNAAR